jgi:hypothetical protein
VTLARKTAVFSSLGSETRKGNEVHIPAKKETRVNALLSGRFLSLKNTKTPTAIQLIEAISDDVE